MKKNKLNINRAPVSKEEIESKRNFESVLKQFTAFSNPFYKTKLFLNSLLIVLFATVVVYTVTKLEREVQKAKAHENDGYAQLSDARQIGSIDSLETQEFRVRIHEKGWIITAGGAIIDIPANALQATDSTVVLLVKEASTMEDMIRAGLTTKSGKDLLSSGGMFYIQAKDSVNVKIVKPITVSIPTDEVNEKMRLYKGQPTVAGKIDWQDPVALKSDTTALIVSEGEILFKENCKSCHTLGKESVGPDLAYIGKRRDLDWIARFVKNNAVMRANACAQKYAAGVTLFAAASLHEETGEEERSIDYSNDAYAICVYEENKKAEMTAFPTFSNKDISVLCNYLNQESKRLKVPYPKDEGYIHFQKCKTYKELISTLNNQKNTLKHNRTGKMTDNGPLVKQVNRSMRILQLPADAVNISVADRKSLVSQNYQQSEFYQVEINTFGWYNIDMLSKAITGAVDSKVFVQVSDTFLNKFQIYLVIPEIKLYGAGGLLKDKKDLYGFYEDNGSIKLLQGKTAHVYLAGEKEGKLLYAAASFITDTLNNLRLYPELISTETFNKKIAELLHAEGMSVKATDSKNASAIRKIDSDLKALEDNIKEAEKLKPLDCDCNCSVQVEKEYKDSVQVFDFQ